MQVLQVEAMIVRYV